MKIEKRIEHEIPADRHAEITFLRNRCFPEAAVQRSYFKQLPHFRVLAIDGGSLVGHMGIDHRVISVSERPYQIFGVVDLCVSENHRGKGIAGTLLKFLTKLAADASIDFLMLFANDDRLYRQNGFTKVSATVTWLKIDEHRHCGIGSERIENEILIQRVGDRSWPEGEIDLLGYLF